MLKNGIFESVLVLSRIRKLSIITVLTHNKKKHNKIVDTIATDSDCNVFQSRGELVILRYASRWGHEMLRNCLAVSSSDPARHMSKSMCPCQFIELHLKCKPRGKVDLNIDLLMFHTFDWFQELTVCAVPHILTLIICIRIKTRIIKVAIKIGFIPAF